MLLKIPRGKTLELRINKKSVFESDIALQPINDMVKMVIEEDIQLRMSSNFSPLVEGSDSSLLSALGAVVRDITNFGFSGQFKELGFQVWKGSDPIQFTITVAFYMETNALWDVYNPAMTLAKLPLPTEGNGIGLVPPGASILTVLGKNVQQLTTKGRITSLQIGNILYMPNVIIKAAEPVFSPETDENYYPIWAKIRLDISSLTSATTNDLNRNFNRGAL